MMSRGAPRRSGGAGRWALLGVVAVLGLAGGLGVLALSPGQPVPREADEPGALVAAASRVSSPSGRAAPREPADGQPRDLTQPEAIPEPAGGPRPSPAGAEVPSPTAADPLAPPVALRAERRPAGDAARLGSSRTSPTDRARRSRAPRPSSARAFESAATGTGDALLEILVLATESGEPIPEAVAEVWANADLVERRQADAEGRVEFTFADLRVVDLVVTAYRRVPLRRRVSLRSGARVLVEAELDAAVALDGRITSARGPVSDVTLRAYDGDAFLAALPTSATGPLIAETTSGPNGRYELDGLPRLARLVVVVRHAEHAVETLRIATGPDSESLLTRDVLLEAPVSSAGYVSDAEGEPVAGAVVYAVPASIVAEAAAGWRKADMTDEQVDELAVADALFRRVVEAHATSVIATRAVTDGNGFAAIEGLDPGEDYYAMAALAGGAHSTADGAATGGVFGRFNLNMYPLVDIVYRPQTEQGAPAERPTFRHPWRHVELALTQLRGRDETGWWGTAHVSAGATAVRVDDDVHEASVFGGFVTGDTRVELTLRRGVRVSGIVWSDSGSRVPGAEVRAFGRVTWADATGRYELAGLPRERGVLEARATGFAPQLIDLMVQGDHTNQDITLQPGFSLGFSLVLPSEAPVPAWRQIYVHRKRGGTQLQTDFDWDHGRVLLDDVPYGQLRVAVLVPGYLVAVTSGEASADGWDTIDDVELTRAPLLRGRVVGGVGADLRVVVKPRRVGGIDPLTDGGADFFRGESFPPGVVLRADARGNFATPLRRLEGEIWARLGDGFETGIEYQHQKAGEIHEVPIPALVRLTGTFLQLDRQPIAGGRVSCSESARGTIWRSETYTDAFGRFTITAGQDVEALTATAPDGRHITAGPGQMAWFREQGGLIELILAR